MTIARESVVFFYGKLAGATRREARKLARAAGYRVAETLSSGLDLVVLGEGESQAQTRAALAREFDARSDLAFERGSLRIVSESEFLNGLASAPDAVVPPIPSREGATPAAVADAVGVPVSTIRRWMRRGLLEAIDPNGRFPLLSAREILVAKRLAFLCSGDASEEQVEKRVRAFAREAPEGTSNDLGAVVLGLTLSTDGREILRYDAATGDARRDAAPSDARGQRFFAFAAFPPDGSIESPSPVRLSPEEEQIALAERLAQWNAKTTAREGSPALLKLFGGDRRALDESAPFEAEPAPGVESEVAPRETRDEARAKWREAASRRQVALCAQAWICEREGYWEEAARVYRLAGLAGGADPSVNIRLGNALFLLKDYSAARERFYSALELDPDSGEAWLGLGRARAATGEYDEALAAFRRALDSRPDDPSPRVEIGKLCLRRGDRERAESEFRRAAEEIDDPRLAADVRRLLVTLEAARAT